MLIINLHSNEVKDRFDVKYYNPESLEMQRSIKDNSKKEGFELKKLSDFGKLRKGIFYIPAKEYQDKGVPFIRVSCIKYQTIDVEDLTYLSKEWHQKEKKTRVCPGDIVISKSGTIGNIALIPSWLGESNISQDIIGFNVNKKEYSGFLAAYLTSKLGQIQMQKVKTQQTHAHLTLTPLRKLLVLFNDTIAREISFMHNQAVENENQFVSKINEAKDIMNNALNLSVNEDKNLCFSISSEDLESKFTPVYYHPRYLRTNELLKSSFKTVKLKNISKIIKGIEPGSKYYQKEGIPFIRTSDFVNYGIDRDSYHKLPYNLYEKNKQDLKKGDILFSNDGKIGFSSMLLESDKCIIQSHIKRIRVNDKKLTPEYVFIFLNTKFGLYQIYRRIFIQTTISTIEDGLNEVDIPILEDSVIQKITNCCNEAFGYKEKRNLLLEEAIKKTENLIS